MSLERLQRGPWTGADPRFFLRNIRGYRGMPLVTNILSTTAQLAVAFGTDPDEDKIYEKIVHGMANRTASAITSDAPCKEEIHREDKVDLYRFPTPFWHE